jgi:nitrate/TMAO reductase-like tetraheme cytochrome c subunit
MSNRKSKLAASSADASLDTLRPKNRARKLAKGRKECRKCLKYYATKAAQYARKARKFAKKAERAAKHGR